MKSIILAGLALFFLAVGSARAEDVARDVVRFKNGAVLRGYITEQVPDRYLKIKTLEGVKEYKMADIERIEKEAIKVPGQKSPVLSCVASLLVPGLGQHINDQNLKGFIIEGVYVAAVIGILAGEPQGYGWYAVSDTTVALVGLFYAGWVYGIIDAPISAADINGEREKLKFAEGPGVGEPKLALTPGFLANGTLGILPGANVTFSF